MCCVLWCAPWLGVALSDGMWCGRAAGGGVVGGVGVWFGVGGLSLLVPGRPPWKGAIKGGDTGQKRYARHVAGERGQGAGIRARVPESRPGAARFRILATHVAERVGMCDAGRGHTYPPEASQQGSRRTRTST